ncbi:MAG: YihY/virulence factor BrkB family protein [Lentisphaeria bacterium]|nr:YihY/virulence factor BrkB family protein [Lentisphaeria bacterium]
MYDDKKHTLNWHFRRSVNVLIESLPTFGAAEGQLRASALTYYTLFAIVPVFALLFGVAKGFDLDQWLKKELSERLSEHGEILNWIYNFADTTLRETKGGLVAGIGALILCWSVVKMIGNIENAFNRVWKVKKNRTIFRKFTDYLSFLVIAPVLLLAASSATVIVSRVLREFTEKHAILSYSRPIVEFGIQCVPYLLAWMLFTFIYIFLPNTRVRFSAALFGGVIAGSIYQLLQSGYFFVQMALSRYNVIYGSFSALPLFLIWMYLNWLIMLFGVTLSYLYQSFDYESKRRHDNERSAADKRLLALLITAKITDDFSKGLRPPTVVEISCTLDLSMTLTNEILAHLAGNHVITPVTDSEYDNPGYVPALPVAKMTVMTVLERYDDLAESSSWPPLNGPGRASGAIAAIGELKKAMEKSSGNRPVIELLD